MSVLKKMILGVLVFISLGLLNQVVSQQPTYTIDENFNTGELFRDGSSVADFLILDDGRYLVGGGFSNYGVSPVEGFGMIFSNGAWDNSFITGICSPIEIILQEDGFVFPYITNLFKVTMDGDFWSSAHGVFWPEYNIGGTFSPYNVERAWDVYQMEDGDLLIGGAISSDTLQPNLFRGITRIHADGTHDPTFPIINITPNNSSGAVREIFHAPNGSWYISGSFTAINGHETNHVAKLTAEFTVDTTFVSPFMYDGPVNYTEDIILIDEQSRVWVSGYDMRLLENPNDTIQLCRLLPDGVLDSTFPLIKLKGVYPDSWMTWKPSYARGASELEDYPGNYLIYGSFSHYNDTIQPCITVINDAGVIQDNFFQGEGATKYTPFDDDDFIYPAVTIVEQLENGDLLVGGGFSEFMGQTHHSVVKLTQGFVGVEETKQKIDIKTYPNPASDNLHISLPTGRAISGNIYNAVGMQVLDFPFVNSQTQVDIRKLEVGIYFVKVQLENGQIAFGKFIKQ